MDESKEKPSFVELNEAWSSGKTVGEPGYEFAASDLLRRWFRQLPDEMVPPNVAAALGFILGFVDRKSGEP